MYSINFFSFFEIIVFNDITSTVNGDTLGIMSYSSKTNFEE